MAILHHAKEGDKGAYADWDAFARTQQKSRTGVQYLKRYQQSVNPKMLRTQVCKSIFRTPV